MMTGQRRRPLLLQIRGRLAAWTVTPSELAKLILQRIVFRSTPMKLKLLLAGLVSFSAAAFAATPHVDFHDHLGLQMWSLRETTKTDMKAALDLVKSYKLKEVETAGLGNLTLEQYVAE